MLGSISGGLDSLEVLEAHDVEVVEPLGVAESFVEAAEKDQLVSPHHHAVPAPGRGGLAWHLQLLPRVRLCASKTGRTDKTYGFEYSLLDTIDTFHDYRGHI